MYTASKLNFFHHDTCKYGKHININRTKKSTIYAIRSNFKLRKLQKFVRLKSKHLKTGKKIRIPSHFHKNLKLKQIIKKYE